MVKRDIVVTWPKTKPLYDYVRDLDRALSHSQYICYRVSRLPHWPDEECYDGSNYGWPDENAKRPRCFMVHSGFVRGWCEILSTGWRGDGEVSDGWPAGWYITRSALWVPIDKVVPIKGFQGWRWYNHD